MVLGGLGGILDLADLRALGLVGDVLDLLLADIASGLVGAHRGADQRERALDAGGQQHRRQEPRIHQRPRPLTDPEHRVVSGIGAQPTPGLGDCCLLYTSDAADERSSVDLGGRRIIKKKKKIDTTKGDKRR